MHRCMCCPTGARERERLLPFKAGGRAFLSTVGTLGLCPWLASLVMTCGGEPTHYDAHVDEELLKVLLRYLRTKMVLLPDDDEDAGTRVATKAMERGFVDLVRALEAQGVEVPQEEEPCERVIRGDGDQPRSWNEVVKLNVRGKTFQTTRHTLMRGNSDNLRPGEPFRCLLANHKNDDPAAPIEVDCDPECFDIILRFHRTGMILPPADFHDARLLLEEASRLGLLAMIDVGSRTGGIFDGMVRRFHAPGAHRAWDAIDFTVTRLEAEPTTSDENLPSEEDLALEAAAAATAVAAATEAAVAAAAQWQRQQQEEGGDTGGAVIAAAAIVVPPKWSAQSDQGGEEAGEEEAGGAHAFAEAEEFEEQPEEMNSETIPQFETMRRPNKVEEQAAGAGEAGETAPHH